jgi:hypothetical protein
MTLLHGTVAEFDGPPRGPAWFTDHWGLATGIASDRSGLEQRGTRMRVIVGKLARRVLVADLGTDDDYNDLLMGDRIRRRDSLLVALMRHLGFRASGGWKKGKKDGVRLAKAVCDAGYDGWILPGYFTFLKGPPGADIVLCEPEKILRSVRSIALPERQGHWSRLRPEGAIG